MKTIFKFVSSFFKGIWKVITFIRRALVNMILLTLGAIYFVYTSAEAPKKSVPEKSALVLNLSEAYC